MTSVWERILLQLLSRANNTTFAFSGAAFFLFLFHYDLSIYPFVYTQFMATRWWSVEAKTCFWWRPGEFLSVPFSQTETIVLRISQKGFINKILRLTREIYSFWTETFWLADTVDEFGWSACCSGSLLLKIWLAKKSISEFMARTKMKMS